MRLAVALGCATFAALGVGLTLPGSLLPLLLDRFDIELVEAGSMLAFQPAGYLAAVLASGRLIARFGLRPTLVVSVAVLGIGTAAFGLASGWPSGAAALAVSGLGIGVLEVGANALMIRIGGERRSSLLNFTHLFFGIGSALAPGLATRAVAAGWSWRWVFVAAGVAVVLIAMSWRFVEIAPEPAPEPGPDPAGIPAGPSAIGQSPTRLADPPILLAVLLGIYVGCETGIGSWLTEYQTSVRGISLEDAGANVTLYWLGLTAGRVVLTGFAHRVRDELLILVSAAFACALLACALATSGLAAATALIAATGAGLAGIFPAAIALAGRRPAAEVARATSVLIAGAGVGGIVIPFAMSALADLAGIVAGMAFYAAMLGLLAILAGVLLARAGSTSRRAPVGAAPPATPG